MDVLRSIPHFSDMQVDSLKVMALVCNHMNYQPGAEIFSAGDNDDRAYFLVEGAAEVVRQDERGETIVGTFEQGSFIGALALLANVKRLFTLRAKTPLKCLIIPRKKLSQALGQSGDGFKVFLKNIAASIVNWEEAQLRSGTCTENSLGTTGVSLL
ncbi:cyclic nucleotide-binding domain-containing protein [Salidesulfovibrio onnuriiensis]|uniref:cyclic nucleotide-binding domain-containing protein n=1 Tax=Salidesulfovibrio onnuriiensis TaxID=2583823 RepID=UPI00164FF801|nr:cyclic nucleotide-binding domain-containing protein [Salidesulfovibrio onnuriiensis]